MNKQQTIEIPIKEYEFLLKCLYNQKHLTELPPRLQQEFQDIIDKTYTKHMTNLIQAKRPQPRKTYVIAGDIRQFFAHYPLGDSRYFIGTPEKLQTLRDCDIVLVGEYYTNSAYLSDYFKWLEANGDQRGVKIIRN